MVLGTWPTNSLIASCSLSAACSASGEGGGWADCCCPPTDDPNSIGGNVAILIIYVPVIKSFLLSNTNFAHILLIVENLIIYNDVIAGAMCSILSRGNVVDVVSSSASSCDL